MDRKRVKRVLIYRLGSLGDTVVAVPALHLVERVFPEADRRLLTNMPTHSNAATAFSVLEGSGLVHSYMDYPWKTRNLWQLVQLWWKVIQFRPQIVVYLMAKRGKNSLYRDKWFFHFCGARQVIGLPLGELDQPSYDPATDLWEHEAARLLRCLESLGGTDLSDPAAWDLRLTPAEERKTSEVLGAFAGVPLIACGPGTKMEAKDWGVENWRGLLASLGSEFQNYGLVLVGAAQDAEIGEYVSAEWRGPLLNLCGKLSPRETASVLKNVELFLGPDSGPMHLAAAYGVPCAVPFAARNHPGLWFPIGSQHRIVYRRVACANCGLEVCVEKGKICLTSITVEEMFAAAIEAWKNGQQRPQISLRDKAG